jgi:hypothetical protein
MSYPFKTNPHKASAKIVINNNLIAVCITVLGIMWAFAPERLGLGLLIQFVFAVPLLYISSISYTKVAYYKDVKQWDYLGWFTGTTATAFVLNIIGVLIFFLGYPTLMLLYFFVTWFLLLIYTIINCHHNKGDKRIRIFKFVFFVLIQAVFGLGVIYL